MAEEETKGHNISSWEDWPMEAEANQVPNPLLAMLTRAWHSLPDTDFYQKGRWNRDAVDGYGNILSERRETNEGRQKINR